MRYLCLAYGDGKDFEVLSKSEQDELLAQDDVLRERGDIVSTVDTKVTTVRAWDGTPSTSARPFAESSAPLVGFSIIDATDLDEAIALVADTPCARAKGAIELRPIGSNSNLPQRREKR